MQIRCFQIQSKRKEHDAFILCFSFTLLVAFALVTHFIISSVFNFVWPSQEASTLLLWLGDIGTTQNILSTIKGDNTNNSTPEEATYGGSLPPTLNASPGV